MREKDQDMYFTHLGVESDRPTVSGKEEPTARIFQKPAVADQGLVIDVAQVRVHYRGVEIPTRPTKNVRHLQRQPFAVLTILALHHGHAISELDLNLEIRRLGLLDTDVSPNLRDLRWRIVRPFQDAMGSDALKTEARELVTVMWGLRRLQLNVTEMQVIMPKTPSAEALGEWYAAVRQGRVKSRR